MRFPRLLRWRRDKPIAEAGHAGGAQGAVGGAGRAVRREAGTLHAVIARRPKADAAIQESPGALSLRETAGVLTLSLAFV